MDCSTSVNLSFLSVKWRFYRAPFSFFSGLTFQGCCEVRDNMYNMPNLGKPLNKGHKGLFQLSMVHYKPHQNLVDLLGPRRPKSRCYLAGTYLEAWMKNPIPSSFRLLAESLSGLEEGKSGATHPSIFKPARVHWVLFLVPISLSSFPATSLESWIFSYRQWGNRILLLSLRSFQYAQWTSNC